MEKSISLTLFNATSSKLKLPESTITHFHTGGRMLSFFPVINKNGQTFRKADVPESVAKTALSSTVDIQHVKQGYGVKDFSFVPGQTNTTCGAISDVIYTDDGIDIVCKIEREVAKAFGFGPKDFEPGVGALAYYSQECDYNPSESEFITVDKNDPTKIVKTISYNEGLALGLEPSVYDGTKWNYNYVDGNPVYIAIKPISFSGVGHVAIPADTTANVMKLAASFYPGMDTEEPTPPSLRGDAGGPSADGSIYAGDVLTHPDILTASVDKYTDPEEPDADDKKVPDDHFAASWMESDFNDIKDGKATLKPHRAFQIKEKGDFHRGRLIAAYRALTGMRGAIHKTSGMPPMVAAHALALVRRGLTITKPKDTTKETSSIQMSDAEKEALEAKAREIIAQQKLVSQADHDSVKADLAKALSTIEEFKTTIESMKTEIAGRDAKLAEISQRELSTARFAELDKILAYTDEEKADAEKVKALASLTEDGFRIARLERELAAARTENAKALASHNGRLGTNPVPEFSIGNDDGFVI